MAISFNPASTVARAYARPKLDPIRTPVNGAQSGTPQQERQTATDNRREAPAVQVRLSAEALAVLAAAREETANPARNNPTQSNSSSGPGKTETTPRPSQADLFPNDIFRGDGEENAPEPVASATSRADARQAYAPPGSRLNIVL